jgi:hypothetical protein
MARPKIRVTELPLPGSRSITKARPTKSDAAPVPRSKPIYAGSRYSIRYSPAKHSFPAPPRPPIDAAPPARHRSGSGNFSLKALALGGCTVVLFGCFRLAFMDRKRTIRAVACCAWANRQRKLTLLPVIDNYQFLGSIPVHRV